MSQTRFVPDLTLDSKSMLVGLINHDNGIDFKAGDVIIDTVEANPDAEHARNSKVTLHTRFYTDDIVSFWYNRLTTDLVLADQLPLLISTEGETSFGDLLDTVNLICGTNWSLEDIRNLSFNVTAPNVTMNMSDASPAWKGTVPMVLLTPSESLIGVDDDDGILCFNGGDIVTFNEE